LQGKVKELSTSDVQPIQAASQTNELSDVHSKDTPLPKPAPRLYEYNSLKETAELVAGCSSVKQLGKTHKEDNITDPGTVLGKVAFVKTENGQIKVVGIDSKCTVLQHDSESEKVIYPQQVVGKDHPHCSLADEVVYPQEESVKAQNLKKGNVTIEMLNYKEKLPKMC
jgi:hypothetical protein